MHNIWFVYVKYICNPWKLGLMVVYVINYHHYSFTSIMISQFCYSCCPSPCLQRLQFLSWVHSRPIYCSLPNHSFSTTANLTRKPQVSGDQRSTHQPWSTMINPWEPHRLSSGCGIFFDPDEWQRCVSASWIEQLAWGFENFTGISVGDLGDEKEN